MTQIKIKEILKIFSFCSFLVVLGAIVFNQFYINQHISSYIDTRGWSNISNSHTSFLNIHYANITNNANNIGNIQIRIVDISDSSKIIVEPTIIQVGNSYKTEKMKISNYIIQAKAINESGNYVIHVRGF